MPEYVVERVADALNSVQKPINGSRIHLFGVAYKRDVSDMRESPALDILELLSEARRDVTYTDPYVPQLHATTATRCRRSIWRRRWSSRPTAPSSAPITPCFDYDALVASGTLIVDTRNALKDRRDATIFRL